MPTHNTASGSIQVLQSGQTFLNQRSANALTLILQQNRDRPQSEPVGCAVGNGHGGESHMSDHTAIPFRNQRHAEGVIGINGTPLAPTSARENTRRQLLTTGVMKSGQRDAN
jgi:hypothetical protein